MTNVFPVQAILELACAAQRFNKAYVKEMDLVFATDGVAVACKQPNKILILYSIGAYQYPTEADPKNKPALLHVTQEDKDQAADIRAYYKRLLFAAVSGENEFQTKVNALLENPDMKQNDIGFIACLPSVHVRDAANNQVRKAARKADDGYIADIGEQVLDEDCEVLSVQRSKNFDAWNIDAIINNKMCSWMSKNQLAVGPCVIVKAKVKDHAKHWKHEVPVTRLHYVKAAQ